MDIGIAAKGLAVVQAGAFGSLLMRWTEQAPLLRMVATVTELKAVAAPAGGFHLSGVRGILTDFFGLGVVLAIATVIMARFGCQWASGASCGTVPIM
jgi:hypothetical protein